MKCDLCGEDMEIAIKSQLNSCYVYAHYCGIKEPNRLYWPNAHIKVIDGRPIEYYLRGTSYTPEEWQRVLKLKAFL